MESYCSSNLLMTFNLIPIVMDNVPLSNTSFSDCTRRVSDEGFHVGKKESELCTFSHKDLGELLKL